MKFGGEELELSTLFLIQNNSLYEVFFCDFE